MSRNLGGNSGSHESNSNFFDRRSRNVGFTEEIKQIIKQKSKGRPIHPKTQEPKMSKVHDIMTLLQSSLENEKKSKHKKRKLS